MTTAIEVSADIANNQSRPQIKLKERIEKIRDCLSQKLIERDIPVRLALLSALAGEHILLIGPPGTAKSELARRLRLCFADQTYFERLLTRFSVPEELFGPLSIKELENDKYLRQIDGYLPTASVAFLDEIFKANSAILNSLLTLLNEREFDNGTSRIKTPLITVVGASNELPDKEELLALYDRFLVRYYVDPVSEDGFKELLDLRGNDQPTVEESMRLTRQDLEQIQEAAQKVNVPVEINSLLSALRKFCQKQQIPVSDRRWRKALFLLQVAAYTDGRNTVSRWDCWLLQYCLWHTPEQRETIYKWYDNLASAASPREPERYSKIAEIWTGKLQEDQNNHKEWRIDKRGKQLYKDSDGGETTDTQSCYHGKGWQNNQRLFKLIPFSEGHISGRIKNIQDLIEIISQFINKTQVESKNMDNAIRLHLWIDPDYSKPASITLNKYLEDAQRTLINLEEIKKGFAKLPLEEYLDSPLPLEPPENESNDD